MYAKKVARGQVGRPGEVVCGTKWVKSRGLYSDLEMGLSLEERPRPGDGSVFGGET